MGKPALVDIALMADALRDIGGILGIPSTVDVLLHLPDLVERVRGLAERAETVRVVTADRDARVADVGARIADAVAAERHAIGAWLRTSVRSAPLARNVEHGDHINDDAPPLPSLRMTLLLRDELHRQIKALEAERDRRIDPVEHARAVMTASLNGYGYGCGADSEAMFVWKNIATDRSRLLARVGADVLAEVER